MVAVANVQEYGAVGDGVADDTGAINDAIIALGPSGGVLIFPDRDASQYNIDGGVTVIDTIQLGVHPGITLGGNGSLTIDTPESVTADEKTKIFESSLSVGFAGKGEIHPEWFGAVGDGISDDQPAFVRAGQSIASLGGTIRIRDSVVYALANNISFPASIGWVGRGYLKPGIGLTVNILGPLHEANHDMFDRGFGGLFTMLPAIRNLWNAVKQQLTTSSGGLLNIDVALGHIVYHALTENTVVGVPANPVDGSILHFVFAQPPGASWTVGFTSSIFKIAGGSFTMTPSGGGTVYDSITFMYHTNINRYFEVGRSQNM